MRHNRQLKLITDDFNHDRSQDRLYLFFNGTDNASSLASHNEVLTKMIADLTVRYRFIVIKMCFRLLAQSVTVKDVLGSLRDVEEVWLDFGRTTH